MIKRTILLFLVLVPMLGCASGPTARFSVEIKGEEGKPVEDVRVRGYFRKSDGLVQRDQMVDYTDAEGVAKIQGMVNSSYVDVYASKEGYYVSNKRVVLEQDLHNDVVLFIREKINPVSMYAKKGSPFIPDRSKEYGYDVFAGDLVLKGHSGVNEDIFLRVDRPVFKGYMEGFEQILTLSFPGEKDGIQFFDPPDNGRDSVFKSDHKAPKEGYLDIAKIKISRLDGVVSKSNIRRPAYIRIRSETDEAGNLKSAFYCKIYPGFYVRGGSVDTPRVDMPYYCNPNKNDRNMEYDVGNSLFDDLENTKKQTKP